MYKTGYDLSIFKMIKYLIRIRFAVTMCLTILYKILVDESLFDINC